MDRLIVREGGWSDHPNDRGGCTKYGITRVALAEWRGRVTSCDDVRSLTMDEARAVYRHRYWIVPRIAQLPWPHLRELVFDCAVHHGPRRAVQWVQDAVRVEVDGIVGPQTLAAVALADPERLYKAVLRRRLQFLGRLITDDHRQAAFAAGWLNRVAQFI